MSRFLCFGSLNIDYTYRVPHFVGAGETLAASEVKTFCGGKGLNQSVALAKAGAEVCHAGSIGTDGTCLIEALNKAAVNTDFVAVLPQEKTGHAIIQNTADGENCILLFGGANRCITKEQIDTVLCHFGSGDTLVLQNEINLIAYLIETAKQKGMTVAFTPAPMKKEVRRYPLESVDYILLNETEARALCATKNDQLLGRDALAERLSTLYPHTCFVLTLGGAGALYIHGKERIFQSAFQVKAVDTTAAGDTFAGYFLQSIAAGEKIEEALKTAAAAAAVCVTRKGASPSIPTRKELNLLEDNNDVVF